MPYPKRPTKPAKDKAKEKDSPGATKSPGSEGVGNLPSLPPVRRTQGHSGPDLQLADLEKKGRKPDDTHVPKNPVAHAPPKAPAEEEALDYMTVFRRSSPLPSPRK